MRFRWIAGALWALAIIGEGVGIFWLLRQRVYVGEDGTLVRDPDTGLLEEQGVTAQFPQWAFIALLVLLVVIAALSITGSVLWKKANRLDPARKADKTRFFVQNQLGAIIAIVAFLPLVILIFLNKDMDKGRRRRPASSASSWPHWPCSSAWTSPRRRSSSTRPISRP